MPFFKKKDKNAGVPPQSQPPHSVGPPVDGRPDFRGEDGSNSTFSNVPSSLGRDSNLSSADTRVNTQRDSNGNKQTVVTTTTTTTTTTVTADGQVITEQHERPPSELPAQDPRPRSPDHQAQQIPVQSHQQSMAPVQSQQHSMAPVQSHQQSMAPVQSHQQPMAPAPNIPDRHSRRISQEQPVSPQHGVLEPPPPLPYQQANDPALRSPGSPNFSRPGGRRQEVKQAVTGLHGMGEGLRGAINAKAGEFLGDDPETLAKHREIRDQGLKDARGSTLLQRVQVAQGAGDRNRLKRASGGNLRNGDNRARNF